MTDKMPEKEVETKKKKEENFKIITLQSDMRNEITIKHNFGEVNIKSKEKLEDIVKIASEEMSKIKVRPFDPNPYG